MNRRRRLLAGAALVLLVAGSVEAGAQSASSCPPPLKNAAGACVASCPAGYADTERGCEYRNTSR